MISTCTVNHIAESSTQPHVYLTWVIKAPEYTGAGDTDVDVVVLVIKNRTRDWISVVLAYFSAIVSFSSLGHCGYMEGLF